MGEDALVDSHVEADQWGETVLFEGHSECGGCGAGGGDRVRWYCRE